MNTYPPPPQSQGWTQQHPPPTSNTLNGNPQQNLSTQMGNISLDDTHGPSKPNIPPPFAGGPPMSMQQKFAPQQMHTQQQTHPSVLNGSQPPLQSGVNNNYSTNNNVPRAQSSTTPLQNGALLNDATISNGSQGTTFEPQTIPANAPLSNEPIKQFPLPSASHLPPGLPPTTRPQQPPPNQFIAPGQSFSNMAGQPPTSASEQLKMLTGGAPGVQSGRPPLPPGAQPPHPGQQNMPQQFSQYHQPQPYSQKMPPMPPQPQFMGQQPPSQFQGQHQSQFQGSNQPAFTGHQQPPMPGHQQPPMAGHQQPPMAGHQQPPMSGHQQPPMPGHQQPPMPGHQQPPMPGHQQPLMSTHQQPLLSGHQQPPMLGHQQPPMLGQQYIGQQQPPLPGQQQPPPFPGQQPSMTGLPHMPPPGQYPSQSYPQQPPGMQGRNYNQPGAYNSAPGQYPQGNVPLSSAQQPRRLDPDQMPNPIQVMTENQRAVTGPFVTNQPGLVPPLVTTKSTTQDQGNSGPRFIRSSMYNVPATADMIKQTAVPFSLIVSPFARTLEGEITPPIVDFGEMGPIRCVRCKAYMCPNMQFIDAGRRFQCLLCKATTEVPQEYFQHLDHTGERIDKFERPELVLGTYEFVATTDYCRNNKRPNPPVIIFVIDVSYNNIKSGLVHLLCAEMKRIIKNLPIDQGMDRSLMKVGFITYNNSVHFYNIKGNLAQPQMMVVGDVHEMFMPLLDGFLCDPEESSDVIDSLMEQIPVMFADTRETETILLPAIQAGLEAMRASECSGKLLVFHSSLPISDAPGKLRNRDDRNVLGTEKEKSVLMPQCNTYNNLGQDCVQAGCAVDLFIFNNSYIDLATIGQICRLTGGEIYKYTYFQADVDGQRVINDIIKNIERPIAFDTVMRVRTSTGVRPTDFYGHFFMSNTTDMEIASIDCDKSIAIEIKHDDKLPPEENVYIQVALLYTSCSGQRRLRILNLALKTCTQMADLFRCCDLDAIVLFFAKQMMFKLMELTPRAVKDALELRCAQILACYRKNCASPTSSGQLILPECMKLLPLYASCLMKNDAISGGSDMTCDDRSYLMQFVLNIDLPMSVSYFYPRLIPIHDIDIDGHTIPEPIRCTIEKMTDDGAYILENGVHMFVWLGLALAPEFTQSVFGTPTSQQIDTDRCGIPVFDNALSERIRGIIDSIQAERPRCMRITLVRQRDKLENVLRHFLIEDRGTNGAPSYVDYLCYLHKEIRALLS